MHRIYHPVNFSTRRQPDGVVADDRCSTPRFGTPCNRRNALLRMGTSRSQRSTTCLDRSQNGRQPAACSRCGSYHDDGSACWPDSGFLWHTGRSPLCKQHLCALHAESEHRKSFDRSSWHGWCKTCQCLFAAPECADDYQPQTAWTAKLSG